MFTIPFQDMFDDDEGNNNFESHGGIMSYYSPASTQRGTPQSVSSDLSEFSPGTSCKRREVIRSAFESNRTSNIFEQVHGQEDLMRMLIKTCCPR